MNHRTLTMRCQNPMCERQYSIEIEKKSLHWYAKIDYAVCPLCGWPRRPDLWVELAKDLVCQTCGVPKRLTDMLNSKMCRSCHMKIRVRGGEQKTANDIE